MSSAADSPVPSAWLAKAEEELAAARKPHEFGFAEQAGFFAQQAAEKALKVVQIHRTGAFERTHDLTRLARTLKADASIVEHGAFLNGFYTASRYPDAGGGIPAAETLEAIARATEVLAWSQRRISTTQ